MLYAVFSWGLVQKHGVKLHLSPPELISSSHTNLTKFCQKNKTHSFDLENIVL